LKARSWHVFIIIILSYFLLCIEADLAGEVKDDETEQGKEEEKRE